MASGHGCGAPSALAGVDRVRRRGPNCFVTLTPRTTATAARVLRQLRHDPRTIALMILVPCVM
ncbi:hypothetical protein ACWDLL_33255, partial [Streptomyces griseoincarnatus]